MAAFINTENTVKKIYNTVIDEVLTNIREAFLDEGYDEQLLQELKQMWETKLSQSRALMPSASNDDAATTTSAAGAAAAATSSSTEHHHSHHHHSSGSGGGGGMRLPITQAPTAKEIAHQALTRNLNNMPASVSSVSSSRSQTPSPGPSDVKPIIHMDAATRTAIQALPQQFHYAQQQQHHHHHHQQAQGGNQQQDKQKKMTTGAQLDGHRGGDGGGSSSEDEDDELGAVGSAHGDDEDDDEDDEKAAGNDDPSEYEGKEDPDPLNSGDDLTEPGSPDSNSDLFDTDNVIVCQYDKITRIKNKWKFHLKDGIMNINGRDYLFSKANGDAEW